MTEDGPPATVEMDCRAPETGFETTRPKPQERVTKAKPQGDD